MRQISLLVFISLSITAFGQHNSDKKNIDSLTTELMKANAILKHEKEEADRLQYLLTAKEMALRSTELNDTIFQVLLAVQAYKFWSTNNGDYGDTEIYNALYEALKTFNDPIAKTLPEKINKLDDMKYSKTSLMAEKLCSRLRRNMLKEEWDKFANLLPYERTCPVTSQQTKSNH